MADPIKTMLLSGEHIFYRTRASYFAHFWKMALGFCLLPIFGLGLIILLPVITICNATELAVTNKRIILKSGIVAVNTTDFHLKKIESISINQTPLGMMFNFGEITIKGTGGDGTPFAGIKNPKGIQKNYLAAVEALS